jgi:hypothetical protein
MDGFFQACNSGINYCLSAQTGVKKQHRTFDGEVIDISNTNYCRKDCKIGYFVENLQMCRFSFIKCRQTTNKNRPLSTHVHGGITLAALAAAAVFVRSALFFCTLM